MSMHKFSVDYFTYNYKKQRSAVQKSQNMQPLQAFDLQMYEYVSMNSEDIV